MKSKKIVALALAAAMALSISMTAFAAKFGDKDAVGTATQTYSTKSGDTTTVRDFVGIKYKYYMPKSGTELDSEKVKDGQIIVASAKTEKISRSETDKDGKVTTTTTYTFTDAEKEAAAKKEYSYTFGDISIGDTWEDADYVLYGWKKVDEAPTAPVAKDTEELAKNEVTAGDTDITDAVASKTLIYLQPVLRKKTADEKEQDAAKEAAKEKVAVNKNGTQLNKDQIEVVKSAVSEDKTADALKAANAADDKSEVWDISVKQKGGDTVTMLDGKTVEVEIDRPALAPDKATIKVFHITKDGKSEDVGAQEVKKDDGSKVLKFTWGSFSQFVVTWDENASGAAASDATSTSTGTGTGTEDAAADAGNVPTGEFSALPVALLAVAALSATGVVAYKKRIAE